MELLKQIKKSMRISHSALDDTLQADMDAGALDLLRVGVQPYLTDSTGNRTVKEDALIYKAIELYAKAQEDYEGKGERYQNAYENLRDSLSLCGDYNE